MCSHNPAPLKIKTEPGNSHHSRNIQTLNICFHFQMRIQMNNTKKRAFAYEKRGNERNFMYNANALFHFKSLWGKSPGGSINLELLSFSARLGIYMQKYPNKVSFSGEKVFCCFSLAVIFLFRVWMRHKFLISFSPRCRMMKFSCIWKFVSNRAQKSAHAWIIWNY